MRAHQFIRENVDSNATNELDLYIMNNEDLYRRRFMPIIQNLKRKVAKNTYDHERAKQLWQYLIDDAAKEYVKEFGTPGEDVKDMFPKLTREKVVQVLADRELQNLEQGEYNVSNRTVS